MVRKELILVAALVVLPLTTRADSQRIVWGELAELVIPVGVEQQITTDPPTNLEIGVPPELSEELDLLVAAGRIFLTAKTSFRNRKIVIRHSQYGSMVVRLSAVPETASLDYTLTLPVPAHAEDKSAGDDQCSHGYIELARWALQQLYAPERLTSDSRCLVLVPINDRPFDLFRCGKTMLCGGGAAAVPIASWKGRGHWVHALKIKNYTPRRVLLDPRDIGVYQGLLAVSFAHAWLDASGGGDDTTVAVLIADNKLDAVIPATRWLK